MHLTIKLEEAPGTHAKLAQSLVEHHRHTVAVYGFVRDSLAASQPHGRQLEAVSHVRLAEACSDWLELLEPGLEPHVRVALNLYLEEVGKVARVVRREAPSMETDVDRLGASLDGVLRILEASAEARYAVDKCHSDTTV
ncbi:MAG: hypothetical protein ACLQU1_35825 [Bryobacteraceae bacterium]